jgi:nitrilase
VSDNFAMLKLAAVQAAPVFLNKKATIDKACALIREAGANGAEFIGFPENFVPGYPLWYFYQLASSKKSLDYALQLFKNSMELPGPELTQLCEAAAAAKVFVVMGITERMPNTTGTLFNTQIFIDRQGRYLGKHQKIVPTVTERLVHAPGSASTQGVISSEYGPVSGLVCGENSNPLSVALLTAQYTRVHVSCWPNHFVPATKVKSGYMSMPEASLLASRNMAYMSKCYVVSSCGVVSDEMIGLIATTDDERAFMKDPKHTGGSAIIDPMGNVIAGPLPGPEEGIVYADADLENNARMRTIHDFGGHYNRADVFQLQYHSRGGSLIESGTVTQNPSLPLADDTPALGQ